RPWWRMPRASARRSSRCLAASCGWPKCRSSARARLTTSPSSAWPKRRRAPLRGRELRMGRLDAWAPRVLSLLRIVAALLFMEHGLMKIFEFPAAQQGIPSPMPAILVAAGWIEIIGGALIALGLFTRVAAFVASGEMAVAFFMGHVAR